MNRTVTLAGFAVLAAVTIAVQLLALVHRPTPTLGQAVGVVLGTRFGRPLVLAAWLWLGWHLFVRGAYS